MELNLFVKIADICAKLGGLIVAIFAVIKWFDSVKQRKKERQTIGKYMLFGMFAILLILYLINT